MSAAPKPSMLAGYQWKQLFSCLRNTLFETAQSRMIQEWGMAFAAGIHAAGMRVQRKVTAALLCVHTCTRCAVAREKQQLISSI